MAKVTIEEAHQLTIEEARRRLDALAAELASKYGIEANWISEHTAEFKRTGVSGSIVCSQEHVCVTLDLSFALLPLKKKVEERIRSELKRTLG